MMRGSLRIRLTGVLVACTCALVAAPVSAQGSYSPYDESASTALARYVRTLASDPTDFQSLIGAGRAAIELGDAQAAAGFFARADDANPNSPLPQAGMGAVSVANGDAQAALPYFQRAQQLGASPATFACDRGLALHARPGESERGEKGREPSCSQGQASDHLRRHDLMPAAVF